jgi:hypothetical protein
MVPHLIRLNAKHKGKLSEKLENFFFRNLMVEIEIEQGFFDVIS